MGTITSSCEVRWGLSASGDFAYDVAHLASQGARLSGRDMLVLSTTRTLNLCCRFRPNLTIYNLISGLTFGTRSCVQLMYISLQYLTLDCQHAVITSISDLLFLVFSNSFSSRTFYLLDGHGWEKPLFC